jgi:hypothetical protein
MSCIYRKHFDVALLYDVAVDFAYARPYPVSVLYHSALAKRELSGGVVDALTAEQRFGCNGVVEIKIENVLIFIGIFESDIFYALGNIGVALFELVIYGDIRKMGLPAPIFAALE